MSRTNTVHLTISKGRLRCLRIAFVGWVLAVVSPNVVSFLWTIMTAMLFANEDAAERTARIRMVFPVIEVLLVFVSAPIGAAGVMAARAAIREKNASRMTVGTSVLLAVLGVALLIVSILLVTVRYVGTDLGDMGALRHAIGSLIALTIASSLVRVDRAQNASTFAFFLLIAAGASNLAMHVLGSTPALAVMTGLLSLGGWTATAVALRRAQPASEPLSR